MTERLSDARLREIMAEHDVCPSSMPHEPKHCRDHHSRWPCETRRMAEELIERRKPEWQKFIENLVNT